MAEQPIIAPWMGDNAEALIDQAVSALAAGDLVALPTETVYGLAADATNGLAVARIFAAKGRPRFNPLISHVSGLSMAEDIGVFNDHARLLAEAFWPGPLTLVVDKGSKASLESTIDPLVTAGLPSIALRWPKGPASQIIEAFGRPLAAPSANRSGALSPTRADHVSKQLGASVRLVIDAGATELGLESTIISVSQDQPRLLRAGAIPTTDIEAALGGPVDRLPVTPAIVAPGMMASHYAPNASLRLNVSHVAPGEAVLLFGDVPIDGEDNAALRLNLSLSGDLIEAAANLFAHLADLDAAGLERIAVAPIPDHGLGEAINDRLRRAAAPRPGAESDQLVNNH